MITDYADYADRKQKGRWSIDRWHRLQG